MKLLHYQQHQQRPYSFDILGWRYSNEGHLYNTLLGPRNSQDDSRSMETQSERSKVSHITSKNYVLKPAKDYEIRVTLLWVGENINNDHKIPAVSHLEKWVEAEIVPDVLVIGKNREIDQIFDD